MTAMDRMKSFGPRAAIGTAVLAGCVCLVMARSGDADGYWPSFRGPMVTGVAPRSDPPAEWSETKNIRWKAALEGEGHATPIVWGDRIYLLAAIKVEPKASDAPVTAPPAADPNARRQRPERQKPTAVHKFTVLALDRATGQESWRTVVREAIPRESGHETASQASASPVTDGERLYASFGSQGLYCLDMKGAVLWQKDLGDMKTRNEFGEGASPVLHGDTLVVNWDHEGEDFIVALDKRTGDERWRAVRDEPTSWSTPLIIDDGGRSLAVVSATNKVRAYNMLSGAEVWSSSGLGRNCIPTPVAGGGLVFVMSGYQEPAGLAIRYAGASGDITGTDRIVWKVATGTSYVASPLLYEGRLYFVDRLTAVLSAYDLATGKAHYTEKRLEGLGNVYASPVGAAGRIYFIDRGGNAVLIRHGESFEQIGANKLEDTFDASPVIAGDAIYLRGHKSLYCVGKI